MVKKLMRQNKHHSKTVHLATFFKPALAFVGLLTLVSCSIEPIPRAYPPERHTPRPVPNRPDRPDRPVHPPQAPTPKQEPVTKQPEVGRTRPVIRPPVIEPEQGVNPYDDVPQSMSSPRRSIPSASAPTSRAPTVNNEPSSAAVKGLIKQAQLDMAANKNAAAVGKLERALRMESRNPAIWHQLAKANSNDGKYGTAISMAKKSNIYTAENSPLERLNWQLIKLASKRSGNIKSLKAAIRYEQTHP